MYEREAAIHRSAEEAHERAAELQRVHARHEQAFADRKAGG